MVSRNDHLSKIADPAKAKPVGLAIITHEGPNAAVCSCGGFAKIHKRPKVVDDSAQRHLDKRHNGQGVWL